MSKPCIAVLRLEHLLRRTPYVLCVQQIVDIMSVDRSILRLVGLGSWDDEIAIACGYCLVLG